MRAAALPAIALLLGAASSSIALRRAHGQTQNRNIIESIGVFNQGIDLYNKKDYHAACEKFKLATQLDPMPVKMKIKLAECYEADERIASAVSEFVVAQTAAVGVAQTVNRPLIQAGIERLYSQLSTLTIQVSDALTSLPGLQVTRDGQPVDLKLLGVPVPVDRGTYRIIVKATGKQAWIQDVNVPPRHGRELIKVGSLEDEPAPPSPAPTPTLQPTAIPTTTSVGTGGNEFKPPKTPTLEPARGWSTGQKVGVAIGAVGLASLVVGGSFGIAAIVKNNASNADAHCWETFHCDITGAALRDSALVAANVSTALVVAGGALVGGGIALAFTMQKNPPKPPGKDVVERGINVGLGPQGFALQGRW